jgi:hypothetical protein
MNSVWCATLTVEEKSTWRIRKRIYINLKYKQLNGAEEFHQLFSIVITRTRETHNPLDQPSASVWRKDKKAINEWLKAYPIAMQELNITPLMAICYSNDEDEEPNV